MYKDVGKRILAVMLCVCMLIAMGHISNLSVKAEGDFTLRLDSPYGDYNNAHHKPGITLITADGTEIKLIDENGEIIENPDYTVMRPVDIKQAGMYEIRVKSNADNVTKSVSYEILQRDIESVGIEVEFQTITAGDDIGIADNVVIIKDSAVENPAQIGEPVKLTGMEVNDYLRTSEEVKKTCDFTYEFVSGAPEAGKMATIRIVGVNNYTNLNGPIEEEVPVSGKPIISTHTSTMTYNGLKAGTESLNLQVKSELNEVLEYGKDYDVTFFRMVGENPEKITNNVEAAIREAGIYSYIATGKGDYIGSTATGTFSVTKVLSTATGEFEILYSVNNTIYTGNEICPVVEVRDNGRTLTEGVDYTVSYMENTDCGGNPRIIIKGAGVYAGGNSIQKPFVITPVSLAKQNLVTVDPIANCTYSGAAHTPTVKVVYNGIDLVETGQVSVSYNNNTNAGTATVTIRPLNANFTDSRTVTFKIAPRSVSEVYASYTAEYDYTGQEQVPEVTLLDNGSPVAEENYDVISVNGTKAGEYAITIIGKRNYTGQLKLTYNINARSLEDGNASISFADGVTYVYTGKEIEPSPEDVVVMYGEKRLQYGVDYQVKSYDNNIESVDKSNADAMLTIEGKGNYKGELVGYFTIEGKSLDDGMGGYGTGIMPLLAQSKLVYDGTVQEPVVNVTYNGEKLQSGTDYLVMSNGESNVGKAEVQVIGTGNYKGTLKLSYEIVAKELTEDILTITSKEGDIQNNTFALPYIGKDTPVTPTDITIFCMLNESKELFYTTDYDIEYVDNTDIGPAEMVITGKGNYTGTVTLTYHIKGNIAHAETSAVKKTYTGEAIELTGEGLNVLYSYYGETSKLLEYEKDYEFVYHDGVDYTNVGTSIPVTMKAIGDYAGEKEIYFDIVPKDLADPEGMEIRIKDQIYTGEALNLSMIPETDFYVTYNGKPLVLGADYQVSLKENEEYVECTPEDEEGIPVVITGNGNNYIGETIAYLKIVPRELTKETITAQVKPVGESEFVLVDQEAIVLSEENIILSYEKDGVIFTDEDLEYEIITPEEGYTSVGETTVIIKGIENFAGEVELPFVIKGDIATALEKGVAQITYDATPYYTGSVIEPKVSITYRGVELTTDDYAVQYPSQEMVKTQVTQDEALSPEINIIGIGNYESISLVTRSYVIQKCNLSDAENLEVLWENPEGVIYNKLPQYPARGFTNNGKLEENLTIPATGFVNNKIVVGGFVIEYFNNVEGASADLEDISKRPTITITATNDNPNYTGTLIAYFTIQGRDFAEYEVTVSSIGDYIYTGTPIAPTVESVSVKDTATGEVLDLERDKDYQVSYANNLNTGNKDSGESAPTVIIKGINNFSGEVIKTFTINPKELNLSSGDYIVNISDGVYTGEEIIPEVEIIDTTRTNQFYGSSIMRFRTTVLGGPQGVVLAVKQDYDVQSASEADNVNAGEDNGAVNIIGTNNYTGTINSRTFDIEPRAMSDDSVNVLAVPDQTYTGTAIVPDITVALQGNISSIVLEPNVDYITKLSNNVNVGTATIEIVSNNPNLTGSRIVTFQIVKKSLSDASVVVELIEPQIYQEEGAKPKPVVTDNGIVLKEKVDYTLSYQNNTMLGTNIATVVITAVEGGNYKGTRTEVFSIVDDINLAVVEEIPMQEYTGQAIEPKPTLMKDGKPLTEGTDYSLSYVNNIESGRATIIITGINKYGGTKEITFDIGRDFTELVEAVGFAENYTYTGEEICPIPGKVTCNGKVLKKGEDYTLTYSNNVNVGIGTVTITGAGCYRGSKTYEFNIIHRSVAQCSVKAIADASYTGKKVTPSVQMTYGKNTLQYGTDYTITYINNERPGTARVIINGKGNYMGNKVLTFKIKMDNISGAKGVANSNKKITLSWNKGTSVNGYEIYDSSNKRIARITGTTYSISGLAPNTSYTYKIRSYTIKNGQSYYSSFTNVTVKTN